MFITGKKLNDIYRSGNFFIVLRVCRYSMKLFINLLLILIIYFHFCFTQYFAIKFKMDLKLYIPYTEMH